MKFDKLSPFYHQGNERGNWHSADNNNPDEQRYMYPDQHCSEDPSNPNRSINRSFSLPSPASCSFRPEDSRSGEVDTASGSGGGGGDGGYNTSTLKSDAIFKQQVAAMAVQEATAAFKEMEDAYSFEKEAVNRASSHQDPYVDDANAKSKCCYSTAMFKLKVSKRANQEAASAYKSFQEATGETLDPNNYMFNNS